MTVFCVEFWKSFGVHSEHLTSVQVCALAVHLGYKVRCTGIPVVYGVHNTLLLILRTKMHQLYAIVTWREIVGEEYELQSFSHAGQGMWVRLFGVNCKVRITKAPLLGEMPHNCQWREGFANLEWEGFQLQLTQELRLGSHSCWSQARSATSSFSGFSSRGQSAA